MREARTARRLSEQGDVELVVALDDKHGVPFRLGRVEAGLQGRDVRNHVRRGAEYQHQRLVEQRVWIGEDDLLDAVERQHRLHVLPTLRMVRALVEQRAADSVHEAKERVERALLLLSLNLFQHKLDRPFDARPDGVMVGEEGRIVEDHLDDACLQVSQPDVVEDVLLATVVFRLSVDLQRLEHLDHLPEVPTYRLRLTVGRHMSLERDVGAVQVE